MSKPVFMAGVDGSEGAHRAVAFAAERARAEGAKLRLVHVVDWSPYEVLDVREVAQRPDRKQEELAAAEGLLDPLVAEFCGGLDVETEVHFGHAAETMARLAGEGVTQVFTGRRGRSKLSSLLFGSVSGGLVQVCPVPLTVVP